MERVVIGLLVLVFMLGTMFVAAWLAVRRPAMSRQDPEPMEGDRPAQIGPEAVEFAQLVESALTSMLD